MDQRKTRLFQATFTATGNLAAAARAAELPLPAAKKLRQELTLSAAAPCACTAGDDPALARAVDALESEAVRRALGGVEIPVFHQGRECGSTIKHSDQLLMFLLKTLRPDRYASTREPAGQPPARTVLLDIDLSAAEDAGED